jgi:hypothetical protein
MTAEYWADKIYEAAGMVVNDDQAFGIGNMVEACIAEVQAERDRLRSGFLMAMQYDNKCDQTGQPCDAPKLCACFLEAEAWCNVSKLGKV